MLEETPTKVVSLLGVALTSLALLFTVSASNASFMGSQQSIPNPFGPDKVVAAIDYAAAGYSQFLATNLFQPAQQSYALAANNASWVGSNAKDGLITMLGLPQQTSVQVAEVPLPMRVRGRVAGAETTRNLAQTQFTQ